MAHTKPAEKATIPKDEKRSAPSDDGQPRDDLGRWQKGRPKCVPYCYVVTSRKPIAVFEELNESRAAVQRLLGTTAVVVASIGVNPPGVFYASGQAVGSLFCLMVAHDAIVARYTGLIKEGALRG